MRKRITKAIALLLTLVMSASVSACSSGQSSSAASAGTSGASSSAGKVKLTFGYDEGVGDATRALIKEYNAAHPNVDVEGYNLPQNSNNLHDDFVNKLASQDTSVDVMALDVVYVSEFASAGWIDKLDNVVGSDKSAFLTGPVEGATVNNSIYAAPWITNASALFYRTDVLKKLGVTKVPTTWDEWISVYKKLDKSSGIDYAFSFQGKQSESMVCDWAEFVWGFGGDILKADGTPDINSQQNIAATKQMASLIGTYAPKGTPSYAETESQDVFLQGKALTCRTWSGTWSTFNDKSQSKVAGNVAITTLPVNKAGDTAHSCLGGLDLVINTYIDDAHKAAAQDFIKWMTSEDTQVQMTIKSSQPPTRSAVYKDSDVLKAIPFYADFYNIIANGKSRPITPNYAKLSDAIQKDVHPVLTGNTSAEDALNKLQQDAKLLNG